MAGFGFAVFDGETLTTVLLHPQERWRPHVEALLDEVEPELLHRWVLCGGVDFPRLAEAQHRWSYRGRKAGWIDEMAAFSVARAAAADPALL